MSLNSQELFNSFLDLNTKKIAVAVSGGCDSMALTFLLDEFCKNNKIELFAVTIDHKVRDISSKEAKEVGFILNKNDIRHFVLEVNEDFGSNLEANMRKARYELLYDFCQKEQIKHLFLGHHIGDVAENFLIRLFRGSGLDGLSSMAGVVESKDIKLIRPLLDVSKKELKSYLKEKNIIWFEDETNADESFLRNKIRNFLNTFEESDLINKRIKNASDEISQVRDMFDEEMLKYAKEVLEFKNSEEPKFIINRQELLDLEYKYALKILSLVFQEISRRDYKPRLEDLKKFYHDLKRSRIRDFYGCKVSGKQRIEVSKKIKCNKSFYFTTILKSPFIS